MKLLLFFFRVPAVFGATAFAVLMATGLHVQAQTSKLPYPDAARQRLLIRVTAQYIHTISQGQIDMDSALRIPCKMYGLAPSLAYGESLDPMHFSPLGALPGNGSLRNDDRSSGSFESGLRAKAFLVQAASLLHRPGTNEQDLARAESFLDQASALTDQQPALKIEELLIRANLLRQSGLSCDSVNSVLAAMTAVLPDGRFKGNVLMEYGELLPYGSAQRMQAFRKALGIFSASHTTARQIEAMSAINIEHFILKQYDSADAVMLRIARLQAAIGFRHQQFVYDALAFLSTRKGELTKAYEYSDKCLDCLKDKSDSAFTALFYSRRAIIQQYMVDYSQALIWFDRALEHATADTKLYWYKALLGKVETLNFTGRNEDALRLLTEVGNKYPPVNIFETMHAALLLGDTYDALGDVRKAEHNFQAFLKIAEDFPAEYLHDEFPAALFRIADFNVRQGHTGVARALLERGKAQMAKTDMERFSQYYNLLFMIDSVERRYPSAIRNLELSNHYKDSAFRYSERKKVSELLVKFETEKKERSIRLLNSENLLQRTRIDAADHRTKITEAGVLLLLVIIGLLCNRYYIKQRHNRRLVVHQKELDQKNTYLEAINLDKDNLLKEKKWLLKEVHHRVKNNLQMVTSLLYSQSIYVKDTVALAAVKDSLRRMEALSMIHQKLYQEQNISSVAIQDYVRDLLAYLEESSDTGERIRLRQSIEPIDLDVSQAIPLGLIVTEAIMNAIKHAFPGQGCGTVGVTLRAGETDQLSLEISDDGIGLPDNFSVPGSKSLGLALITGLSKQLNGTLQISGTAGTRITIMFRCKRPSGLQAQS